MIDAAGPDKLVDWFFRRTITGNLVAGNAEDGKAFSDWLGR